MRISRKIGLSFFVTFFLVIVLGALSIYSLRHIYRGLSQVFARDLPASRATYQVAVSMEEVLSELNNFLITGNENFKISYGTAYKRTQDDIALLEKFISSEEEKALFDKTAVLAEDMNGLAGSIFEKKTAMSSFFKDIRAIENKYTERLDGLFDFEEKKMRGEKDFLLVQAQYIPASQLVMEVRSALSNLLDGLAAYVMSGEEPVIAAIMSNIATLEKSMRDYKNYYGYSLSERERALATELIDLSGEIKTGVNSVIDLKKKIEIDLPSLLVKERDFTEALDNIISIKKSGISSKLGVGATLTEDIPAIHNISKLEKDFVESWRLSTRYILTGSEVYKNAYYQLRQNIERETKDYGRHARLRGTERFMDDIVESDKNISSAIDSSIETFEKKQALFSELMSIQGEMKRKIDDLLEFKDSAIKEAKDTHGALDKIVSARWILIRLESELSNASKLVINYLNEQASQYKDMYSELYFNMKKYVNVYRGLSSSEKDASFVKEIEPELDKFNTVTLKVIENHDKIIKDTGWTLVKLENDLKEKLNKAVEAEISQIEKNKKDIMNRIRVINTLIFIIIAIVAFIAIFVILYTANSITSPIQKLYDGAGIIGRGNLDYRLDIKTGDEIQDLAQGFNTMAGELKGLYTDLENKVKERTAQLARANEQLKELDRMKSDFVANVVHELRTPLSLIKGNVDNIEKGYAGEVKPKQKEMLDDVSRITNRLARLVNDLLDLSKIESGKMGLTREDLDIVEMAGEIIKDFEKLAEKKKIRISKEFSKTKIIINADRDKLTQVFVNLIGNAVKFTDKGNVGIKITELQDEVQIEIQDTGLGMTKEETEKIFDKFVRVLAEKKEGTGLGLPIAKDIITLHKGRIRVDSAPGKGSNFIFNLPKNSRD